MTILPGDEATWLVTTAFNRAVSHHRMGRGGEALSMFEVERCKFIRSNAFHRRFRLRHLHHRSVRHLLPLIVVTAWK
jgi:hypothetical protein